MSFLELICFAIAPALFNIFITWAMQFPAKWVLPAVLGFELFVVISLLIIEFNAQNVAGNGGWMTMLAFVLQFWIFIGLVLARWAIWFDQKP